MKFFQIQKNKKTLPAVRGFVILFAVTIASIILAISLSVANVAFNEAKFSTSTRDTNDAFFAADTGTEAVLFMDRNPTPFVPSAGTSFTWSFVVSQLGGRALSCAKVSITKDNTAPPSTRTTIVSKGYSTGGGSSGTCNPPSSSVEREIDTHY